MGTQVAKSITWVIKNFSSLSSESVCSDEFVVGGCKWLLRVYPKGQKAINSLALFLRVANHESLPCGWRRHAKYSLTVVNQNSGKNSQPKASQQWFDEECEGWGRWMCSLDELHARDGGFLANGELKIVLAIEVLEVIGAQDVSDETSTITETTDVNGFQLLPSQVEFARRIFDRHPEIASEFCPKKPNLKTAYMSLLLSLIETMCMLPKEVSKDDLSDAYVALGSMRAAGFKLEWLKKKLDEMSEKKEKEEAGETRMQEMEKELKDLKLKFSDLESQLDKEKEEVLDAKAPFSFDDVV